MRQPDDLDFDVETVSQWFEAESTASYLLVHVPPEIAQAWTQALGVTVRRCYVSDALLMDRAAKLGLPASEVLAARLPDAGSTMSGDFGEILGYLFQACANNSELAIGPKKWRLKEDRTKPAPGSDVLHFVLPDWPAAGAHDRILCAEVKAKATRGSFKPIAVAILGCTKDRTSRLSKTLVWLRERAIFEDLGDVSLEELNRFIEADKHPPFEREYNAIAIVCASLLDGELADAPAVEPTDYSLVVISVPALKDCYTAAYQSALESAKALEDERASE
jgi:hypothetical protein